MHAVQKLLVVFSISIAIYFPASGNVGPAGQWFCTQATPVPTNCSGSYLGSTGCAAFSVNRFPWFGWSIGHDLGDSVTVNCDTFFDSLGWACNPLAQNRLDLNNSCVQTQKNVPIF